LYVLVTGPAGGSSGPAETIAAAMRLSATMVEQAMAVRFIAGFLWVAV
jgi:hypothetical protein